VKNVSIDVESARKKLCCGPQRKLAGNKERRTKI
jgi:hypothetical protein